MKQPNFFIVGAPKCGTSALTEYLGTHPQVFMCALKEPHYFAEDFPRYRATETWEDYLQLFCDAKHEYTAIGEASVYYLYSDVAISNLLRQIPGAKLIVLLRNPVELARSMHAQALYNREEDILSFEEAWRLCETRRDGDRIPASCRDVKVLLYDQLAKLGQQLERLLQHVPRAQVKWWFLDDLSRDPGQVYREVLSFIGVADDGRTEFPQINRRVKHRSQLVGQLVEHPPPWLAKGTRRLKRALFLRRLGVLDLMRRINTTSVCSLPLDPRLDEEMRGWFAPDIQLLHEITGRDLSHWLRGAT